MGFFDRILSFVKLDRSSLELRAFFQEYESRERFRSLTREDIDRLINQEMDPSTEAFVTVEDAVMDCINHAIGDRYEEQFKLVDAMTPSLKMVFSTWWLDAEVENGGFHQFFYNKAQFAFMAAEGCRLLAAQEHLAVLLQAIEIYLREEPDQAMLFNGVHHLFKQFEVARQFSDLPSLDRAYYTLPPLSGMRSRYIRNRPEQFVFPQAQ